MNGRATKTFVCVAVIYSLGFAAIEYILQFGGISDAIIALLAAIHNTLSIIICAVILARQEKSKIKWLWMTSFIIGGVADIMHAFLFWVMPQYANYSLMAISDRLYVVQAAWILLAIVACYGRMCSRKEILAISGVGGVYCVVMFATISVPFWNLSPGIADIVADGIYNVVTAAIVAMLMFKIMATKTAAGYIFGASFVLMYFSDFAIRYYDSIERHMRLSVFNYGWEMGCATAAMVLLWLHLNNEKLRGLFELYPRNSIRYQTAVLSCVALLLFGFSFILVGTKAEWLIAVDVSMILIVFCASWVLANIASLVISANLLSLKRSVENNETHCTSGSVNEVAAILDVFAKKHRELAMANDTISRQKRDVEAIYRRIAHDMRTPLATIKTCLSAVGVRDDEAHGICKRNLDRLIHMSDGMFDYSKAGAVRRNVVDLAGLLQRAFCAYRDMVVSVNGSATYVFVDGDKLERVFVNLAENAYQAINGVVSGRVLVRVDTDGKGDFLFEIIDNGAGICVSDISRIFEEFYTKGKIGGTGLGLAYCKQVVEAHGGTIEVQSEVGKGSTFTIRIPNCVVKKDEAAVNAAVNAADIPTSAGPQPNTPASSDCSVSPATSASLSPRWDVVQEGKRYLIIDDDPAMRTMMQRLIDQAGGRVAVVAGAPDEVLFNREISDKTIDAALVDYHFEGSEANGVDLIRFLRARGIATIHLCTGFHDDPAIRDQAISAGADGVISKPGSAS